MNYIKTCVCFFCITLIFSSCSITSVEPSSVASAEPSSVASVEPSSVASVEPSSVASVEPSSVASAEPSSVASAEPSSVASVEPSSVASVEPSSVASVELSSVASVESDTKRIMQFEAQGMEYSIEELKPNHLTNNKPLSTEKFLEYCDLIEVYATQYIKWFPENINYLSNGLYIDKNGNSYASISIYQNNVTNDSIMRLATFYIEENTNQLYLSHWDLSALIPVNSSIGDLPNIAVTNSIKTIQPDCTDVDIIEDNSYSILIKAQIPKRGDVYFVYLKEYNLICNSDSGKIWDYSFPLFFIYEC